MIIVINEDITKEVTDKIARSLNELPKGDKLFLYFSTEGGSVGEMEAIIHIINNNVDLIELVAYDKLYSAGFDIFFKSLCHKILLHGTIGMCHYSKTSILINENGNPYDKLDQANKVWTKSQKEYTIAFCRELAMTDKEISEIRQGKDVYFQPKRMQEFLKTSQQNINT